mgnify:CR=1 FL=1
MGVFSKVMESKFRLTLPISAVLIALYLVKLKRMNRDRSFTDITGDFQRRIKSESKKIFVDLNFLQKLMKILKTCALENGIPLKFLMFNISLVLRTILSIYISIVKGKLVKSIISCDQGDFIKSMGKLAIIAVPGSVINSYLEYLEHMISLSLRKGVVNVLNNRYLQNKTFYQILNVDSRIQNPEQILTDDIKKWADSLTELYSDFSKPFLDIILFSRKLSEIIGWKGPFLMISWYVGSGWLIKLLSPAFARMTNEELKLEGIFRSAHQRLIQHSEEVAFLRGDKLENASLDRKLKSLLNVYKYENKLRFFMGIFDSMLVKYGAFNLGLTILALPVFGPDQGKYLLRVKNDPSMIIKDYEQNSSLLVNLAKAIGRIVISYKKLQELAGTTHRVAEIFEVLDDINTKGRYVSHLVDNKAMIEDSAIKGNSLTKGKVTIAKDFLKIEEVPIISPKGDKLIDNISFKVQRGMNFIIAGPNGCGKTALLRVMAGLWPFFNGQISINNEDFMYCPAKAYLPSGPLRNVIIYPHTASKKTDSELLELLAKVNLSYIAEREGGLDASSDWYDQLSGGERQRISITRLFYHCPKFAALDEATSAVSVEMENEIYQIAKGMGISLITVTQRPSLYQLHDYCLKFTSNKEWTFEKISHDE